MTVAIACPRMITGSRLTTPYTSVINPPPIEKNQNAIGTTLCPARSLEIHCTRKRAVKNNCATRPNASQKSN